MGQLKPSLVGMFIGSFLCSYFMNSVSGVNVSAVDLGLNPSPIKPIKGYIIGNCYFFAQNVAFRVVSKSGNPGPVPNSYFLYYIFIKALILIKFEHNA